MSVALKALVVMLAEYLKVSREVIPGLAWVAFMGVPARALVVLQAVAVVAMLPLVVLEEVDLPVLVVAPGFPEAILVHRLSHQLRENDKLNESVLSSSSFFTGWNHCPPNQITPRASKVVPLQLHRRPVNNNRFSRLALHT